MNAIFETFKTFFALLVCCLVVNVVLPASFQFTSIITGESQTETCVTFMADTCVFCQCAVTEVCDALVYLRVKFNGRFSSCLNDFGLFLYEESVNVEGNAGSSEDRSNAGDDDIEDKILLCVVTVSATMSALSLAFSVWMFCLKANELRSMRLAISRRIDRALNFSAS